MMLFDGDAHERAQRKLVYIEAMWLDGFSTKEIADELGTSTGTVETIIHRMRDDGWNLPYRYAMQDGRRVAQDE